MARDPFRVLSMVRRHAIEQARQALAACMRAEAAAMDRIRMIDEALERDRQASRTAEHTYQFLEMAAIRLEAIKAERQAAAATLAAAASRSAEARNIVVAARTAAEAVTTLIDEHKAADELEANRRTQHALDDMTRARHGGRR